MAFSNSNVKWQKYNEISQEVRLKKSQAQTNTELYDAWGAIFHWKNNEFEISIEMANSYNDVRLKYIEREGSLIRKNMIYLDVL